MGLGPGMSGEMGDLWLINTSVDWLRNAAKKEIVLHGLLGIMMDYEQPRMNAYEMGHCGVFNGSGDDRFCWPE
jgi:hypothetical protein